MSQAWVEGQGENGIVAISSPSRREIAEGLLRRFIVFLIVAAAVLAAWSFASPSPASSLEVSDPFSIGQELDGRGQP